MNKRSWFIIPSKNHRRKSMGEEGSGFSRTRGTRELEDTTNVSPWSFILILIILVAFIIRVWNLEKTPIELFGDEIDVGLQSFSILKTGKDYLGHSFPILFQSFAEYRLPLLIYSSVPFVAIFGLNEWGVRLSSVLMGLISIIGIFLLAKKIFGVKVGLISAFLFTLSPWHLHFSRWANDAIGILIHVTFGSWFFLNGFKRFKFLLISTIILSLSVYSYSIALVFLVPYFITLFFLFRSQILKYKFNRVFILITVSVLIITPYLYYSLRGQASERFNKISIFSDQSISERAINSQSQSQSWMTKLFRNKVSLTSLEVSKNYLSALSGEFLFIKGDPIFRHSVGDMGELYFFQAILLVFGFFWIMKAILSKNYNNKNELILILAILIISPIPASLTKEGGNHSGRLILLLVPLTLISAVGLNQLLMLRFKFIKIILIAILLFSIWNITSYFYRYYFEWTNESWRFWQSGYKEAMTFLKTNDNSYARIYFNSTYEPALPRFMFWYQYNPAEFQKQYKGDVYIKDLVAGFNGFKLGDKYYFGTITKLVEDQGFAEVLEEDELYMASKRDEVGTADWINSPPKNVEILKTIKNPYGVPIFFILRKKPANF